MKVSKKSWLGSLIGLGATFLFAASWAAKAEVPGVSSLECHDSAGGSTHVTADIWMTGHPQGGITSLEGIMRVEAESNGRVRGHTLVVRGGIHPFAFSGSARDLSRLDYLLRLDSGLMDADDGKDVSTTLEIRDQPWAPPVSAQPPTPPRETVPLTCRWTR
jgi:hypothetical protein